MTEKDFRRLGVRGDFNDPYITLKPEYEAAQIRIFEKMADKGLIYKGKKPVYWSPSSESSLAEAEIEYHDKRSASIYVAFNVKDDKGVVDADAKFIIWTTMPWTIPSNVAITVHPELKYGQYNVNGGKYIIAEALSDAVAEALAFG
ncbi:class I tRNA ligase family protein [Staphylococcus aureus]|nr:class I tRNA ligase family protein [Staphylococcus aureus]